MNHFLLDFLSLAAILSGILVIISKNPVISVLFLISVFVNVAGYLVVLGLGFIGISYLIVYVGAIAILFLFVVMMLNLQLAEISAKEYTQNLPLGLLIGSIFVFELVSLLPFPSNYKGSATGLLQQAELGLFHSIPTIFSHGHENTAAIHSTFVESVDTNFQSFLQIQSIGQFLYTSGSMWLLLSSIILLLAMVGPIILTLLPSRQESSKNNALHS